MRFAFAAYRQWLALPALAVVGLIAFAPSVELALPSVTGYSGVPVRVMAALAGCLVVAYAVCAGWPDARTVPVRSTAVHLAAVTAVMWASASALGIVLAAVGIGTGMQFAGVLAWLLGIQLIVGVMVSWTYQAMAPAVYVLLCALFGRIDSVVQPWAWVLADAGPASLPVGVALLAVGLVLVIVLRPHASS